MIEILVSAILIGLIFILVGLYMKYNPPKKINNVYGYRTKRSMLSEHTWKEANTYSAILMIWGGLGYMLVTVFLVSLIKIPDDSEASQVLVALAILLLPMFVQIGILFYFTEKRLKDNFDQQGNPPQDPEDIF